MNDEISNAMTIMELARNLAAQASDRANQVKSRYLAAVSHDLRQQLQAIALLDTSLRRLVSDTEANVALSLQEQTIAAMSWLVDALLDISKLDSGAIKPAPADLGRAVRGAAQGICHLGVKQKVSSCGSIKAATAYTAILHS